MSLLFGEILWSLWTFVMFGCFDRFGGYERWRLWPWRLWTPPINVFGVHKLQNFGGYDLWRLWAWRLWTFPIPLIFGGYERWTLWFWRLWTLEVVALDVLICHPTERFFRFFVSNVQPFSFEKLHWTTKFKFCHSTESRLPISVVICGADHESGTRNGVSG